MRNDILKDVGDVPRDTPIRDETCERYLTLAQHFIECMSGYRKKNKKNTRRFARQLKAKGVVSRSNYLLLKVRSVRVGVKYFNIPSGLDREDEHMVKENG